MGQGSRIVAQGYGVQSHGHKPQRPVALLALFIGNLQETLHMWLGGAVVTQVMLGEANIGFAQRLFEWRADLAAEAQCFLTTRSSTLKGAAILAVKPPQTAESVGLYKRCTDLLGNFHSLLKTGFSSTVFAGAHAKPTNCHESVDLTETVSQLAVDAQSQLSILLCLGVVASCQLTSCSLSSAVACPGFSPNSRYHASALLYCSMASS